MNEVSNDKKSIIDLSNKVTDKNKDESIWPRVEDKDAHPTTHGKLWWDW